MVGGAYGPAGHLVQQRVEVVREPGNAPATILHPRVVEVPVLVAPDNKELVTLQIVQVRSHNMNTLKILLPTSMHFLSKHLLLSITAIWLQCSVILQSKVLEIFQNGGGIHVFGCSNSLEPQIT